MTTLELFFDLVFAFTLTQLTALLSGDLSLVSVAQVLLIFGALWWMYGGYAWLTNTRPPVRPAERILLLVGMAGFLTTGLAIPHAFSSDGVAFGAGFLVVTLVHGWLYYRVNANILRVAPFNVGAALLIISAGLVASPDHGPGPAGYALWLAALVVLLGSPLIVHPKGLFEIRPAHFVERYGALLIVALGESVAAVGIGAASFGHPDRAAAVTGHLSAQLIIASILGLALAAVAWWTIFGDGSDDRALIVLTESSSQRRVSLALSAYFYGNIPLLLGVVAIAAGVEQAIGRSAGGGRGRHRRGRRARGRRGAVPGRGRRVPAAAGDRPGRRPRDRGGRGPGQHRGRGGRDHRGAARGGHRRADRDAGHRAVPGHRPAARRYGRIEL